MFRNYLKIAIRNLMRRKFVTLINILGLSIGMAFCILAFLYLKHELSYDSIHTNGDRIYRVIMDNNLALFIIRFVGVHDRFIHNQLASGESRNRQSC
jgi:hypothetical protein